MGQCFAFKAFDGVEFTSFKPTLEEAIDEYLGQRLGHAMENSPRIIAEAFERNRNTILEFAKAQKWYRRLKINTHWP
jgi:hypothetical protein